MKTERFDYLYLLFGIYCGFLLGSFIDGEAAAWVGRILSTAAILFVASRMKWIEAKSHRRHIEQWQDLKAGGKWHFVFVRYVLIREVVILIIFVGPLESTLKLSLTFLGTAAFVGAVLAPVLVYLGHQEWNDCERESEIQTLRIAADFISSKQN